MYIDLSSVVTACASNMLCDSCKKIEASLDRLGIKHCTLRHAVDSYSEELNHYETIKQSQALIYCTKSAITNISAHKILYTMLQQKPIILTGIPTFATTISLFSRETIMNRFSKLMICDLEMLDDTDLMNALRNMTETKINYVLTKHEETLIRAALRAHFRKLLAV